MFLKLRHAKFQRSSAKATFSNSCLNGGGRKNVRFQWKTGHMSETVKDTAINRKWWHTLFQIRWKSSTFDDLKGHWQPVRSSILPTARFLVGTLGVGQVSEITYLTYFQFFLWLTCLQTFVYVVGLRLKSQRNLISPTVYWNTSISTLLTGHVDRDRRKFPLIELMKFGQTEGFGSPECHRQSGPFTLQRITRLAI